MYDTEYEKIVEDINVALNKLCDISYAHNDVIQKLKDMWGENEESFYEDLDIRKYANSPSKTPTNQQRIDRFNKTIRDIIDPQEE